MKRILLTVYCALFFGSCAFFSLGMLIPGAASAAEGAELPALFFEGGINSDFADDFDNWFAKSFAYRNTVVDVYAAMKENLFGEGNDQVIVGREDFLFFADTLDCYTGASPMTDDEIRKAADALLAMRQYVTSKGADFLVIIAPNKNTVYSEYMPYRYTKTDEPTDLDRLLEAINGVWISSFDLREELITAKADGLLYHKRDTHWNGAGAKIACDRILDYARFRQYSSEIDYSARGPITANDIRGDLDTLLYPGRVMFDENITYDFDGLFAYTSAFGTEMDMTITTRGGGEGKLLMFRDSFANAMIPYLASAFEACRFERANPYRVDLLESEEYDLVVIEIAERNIRDLIGSAERVPKELFNY